MRRILMHWLSFIFEDCLSTSNLFSIFDDISKAKALGKIRNISQGVIANQLNVESCIN